jgi:CRP-like cAMP-binding protein
VWGGFFVSFKVDTELETKLLGKARNISMQAGALLFNQGDAVTGVYILSKGRARLTLRSIDGKIYLEEIVGRGGLLGLPAAISGTPYSLTAEVLSDSELAFLSREELVRLMQSDVSLSLKLVELLSQEVRAMRDVIAGPASAPN